jgi:hypothetical protein
MELGTWHLVDDLTGGYVSQDFHPLNYPRCRLNFAATSISPSNGQLELLVMTGGMTPSTKSMNDVWYYSPLINQFRWVYGTSAYPVQEFYAYYGTFRMEEDPQIRPGSRRTSVLLPIVEESSTNSSFFLMFGGLIGWNGAVYTDVMRLRAEFPCPAGYFFNFSSSECLPCSLGQFSSTLNSGSSCLLCTPGSFSNTSGSTFCQNCSIGRHGPSSGLSTCVECESGTYTSVNGSENCLSCPDGMIAGLTSCFDCPLGTYSSYSKGITSCLSCPEYATTLTERSWDIRNCICPRDFYGKPFENSSCATCPKTPGLTCPANSSIPFIEAGYSRDPKDIAATQQCHPSSACMQSGYSQNTMCSSGYTGATCGECSLGTH